MPQIIATESPKRILSATGAKRLRVSRPTFSKYERRGILKPDYVSDGGTFYNFDRLPLLAEATSQNRSEHWRQLSAA
jgi:DNA-binding transcriptional MerR regulator